MYPMKRTRKPKRREGPVRPTKGLSAEDQEVFLAFLNDPLSGPTEEIPADRLEEARRIRKGLCALIAADSGVAIDGEALAELDRLAPKAKMRLGAGGLTALEPVSDGFDGVVERLFAIAVRARFENHWPRFKLCSDATCRRAFYDASRSLIGRWCSARCRDRHSTRLYRRRRAG